MTRNQEIAQIIRQQIGGGAMFMMGAQNLIAIENGLSFRVRGSNIANHITVVLKPSDTYIVTFNKIWGTKVKLVKEIEDVYCDQLRQIIGDTVKLATRL